MSKLCRFYGGDEDDLMLIVDLGGEVV